MEYAKVDIGNGSFAWLPEKMSVRAPHRYQQNIETRPPDHRVWNTVDKGLEVVGDIGKLFLLNEIINTSGNSAGTQYRGDYVTNSNSYNSTSSTSTVAGQ
jgi:hypothetical protein